MDSLLVFCLRCQITLNCLDKKLFPHILTQGWRPLAKCADTFDKSKCLQSWAWTRKGCNTRPCQVESLYTSVTMTYLHMRKAILSISCFWVLYFGVYTTGTAVTCPLTDFGGLIGPWWNADHKFEVTNNCYDRYWSGSTLHNLDRAKETFSAVLMISKRMVKEWKYRHSKENYMLLLKLKGVVSRKKIFWRQTISLRDIVTDVRCWPVTKLCFEYESSTPAKCLNCPYRHKLTMNS